jgi:hypothetical protein
MISGFAFEETCQRVPVDGRDPDSPLFNVLCYSPDDCCVLLFYGGKVCFFRKNYSVLRVGLESFHGISAAAVRGSYERGTASILTYAGTPFEKVINHSGWFPCDF